MRQPWTRTPNFGDRIDDRRDAVGLPAFAAELVHDGGSRVQVAHVVRWVIPPRVQGGTRGLVHCDDLVEAAEAEQPHAAPRLRVVRATVLGAAAQCVRVPHGRLVFSHLPRVPRPHP